MEDRGEFERRKTRRGCRSGVKRRRPGCRPHECATSTCAAFPPGSEPKEGDAAAISSARKRPRAPSLLDVSALASVLESGGLECVWRKLPVADFPRCALAAGAEAWIPARLLHLFLSDSFTPEAAWRYGFFRACASETSSVARSARPCWLPLEAALKEELAAGCALPLALLNAGGARFSSVALAGSASDAAAVELSLTDVVEAEVLSCSLPHGAAPADEPAAAALSIPRGSALPSASLPSAAPSAAAHD